MKIQELRTKSKEELQALLAEKRQRLEEVRWLVGQKKSKNVKEAFFLRKEIARILTLIHNHA